MTGASQWTIRNLLRPVATRALVYGVSPFDLEQVLSQLDSAVIINTRQLEKMWFSAWEAKAEGYAAIAHNAEAQGALLTARELHLETARSLFAKFLINTSRIELKRESYVRFAAAYREYTRFLNPPVNQVTIRIDSTASLAAYLHEPPSDVGLLGSVVFFAGLGSCKEEMHVGARALAERGIAVLVPDMPGCGESLFLNNAQCKPELVEKAFRECLHYLQLSPVTTGRPVGAAGLCMGGGYAFRAAALNPEYRFCATLFPLFIAAVDEAKSPQWMHAGEWFVFQTGGAVAEELRRALDRQPGDRLSCPFFMAHGKNDNWMSLKSAIELFECVDNECREKLIVGHDATESGDVDVIHAMPVGEQLHWVKHCFADWVAARARTMGSVSESLKS